MNKALTIEIYTLYFFFIFPQQFSTNMRSLPKIAIKDGDTN